MDIIALVISPNGFDLLLLGTLLKRIYSSGKHEVEKVLFTYDSIHIRYY